VLQSSVLAAVFTNVSLSFDFIFGVTWSR